MVAAGPRIFGVGAELRAGAGVDLDLEPELELELELCLAGEMG